VSRSAERADRLTSALQAGLDGDHRTLAELCTADLRAWTPRRSTASLDELVAELSRHDPAFSDLTLETFPLDVDGEFACVEWVASMTHSGPLPDATGGVVEPTGVRVTVMGVTVAEFMGERICSLRQYWDESTLFDQLGLDADHGHGRDPSNQS
jgi:SnoaL-like polyketide cyclase